jgi:hypothetical protein
MLFQAHYSLDPYSDFEPYLANLCNTYFTDKGRECTLVIRHRAAHLEDEKTSLDVFLNKHVRGMSDELVAIFRGTGGSARGLMDSSPDGFQCYGNLYRSFIMDLHREIDTTASDIFNTMRWRLGIDGGPHRLISCPASMRWQDDSTEMTQDAYGFLEHAIPIGISEFAFPQSQELSFGEQNRRAVEKLLATEAVQPLHHDLFREAWQNRNVNPRSSLVIVIASLETAVKATICELQEPLRWVFEKLVSPPVDKLLREYIPQLPAQNKLNGRVRRPPTHIITTIKKGIEQRNHLVHGREEDFSVADLQHLFLAIRDVLYLLDYYRGHDWAVDRIRSEVVNQLLGEP